MKTRLQIIALIFALISSCVSSKSIEDGNDKCIPPLYDVAFPVVTPPASNAVTRRQIAPQGKWQVQADLPVLQDELGGALVARPQQHELWFGTRYITHKYSIDKKQWKSYQTGSPTLIAGNLFVSSDGTVWEVGTLFLDTTRSGKSYPFLSRFNEASDRFEDVEDVSGFLQSPQVRLISNVAEDQSGLLWFFVAGDKNTLVSFDARTRQSQQHYYFRIAGGNTNLVIGPDGSVWFRDYANEEIVQYITSTQETRTYKAYPEETVSVKMSPEFDKAGYIFMDRSRRLWIANYAWLDFSNSNSPEWHRVIESPVFVTESGLPDSEFSMSYQVSTYQSSNDWYWFTGGSGIVRLDLEKGTWCLMTTGTSNVVEDNDHNLWIAVFGHLYKYPLTH